MTFLNASELKTDSRGVSKKNGMNNGKNRVMVVGVVWTNELLSLG